MGAETSTYLPVHWELAATPRAVKQQVAREYRCTESPITTELFAGHDLQTESQLSVVVTLYSLAASETSFLTPFPAGQIAFS